jgi:dienelactone hydrolase
MRRMKRFLWLVVGLVWFSGALLPAQAGQPLATPWRASQVTNEVLVTRADWRDASRDRVVPVKIYSPQLGSGPFPVVIFSHGLGGTREGYEYLGQCWASHGYVAVHLQHVGSDDSVWKDAGIGKRMSAMQRAAAQPRNAMDRTQDVSFALDQLTQLNATNSAWRGKLDLTRVGVSGHSFGAYTTLASAGAAYSALAVGGGDARIKAAIPMSAPVPANKARLDDAYAGVKIPCLHMTGTEDNSPIGDTKAEERRLPFDHCRNSDQFLITFTGGDHAIFGGRERKLGGGKDAEFQRLISQSSLAFLDAYLRNDAKAKEWLTTKFKDALGKEGVLEVKQKK